MNPLFACSRCFKRYPFEEIFTTTSEGGDMLCNVSFSESSVSSNSLQIKNKLSFLRTVEMLLRNQNARTVDPSFNKAGKKIAFNKELADLSMKLFQKAIFECLSQMFVKPENIWKTLCLQLVFDKCGFQNKQVSQVHIVRV